MNTPGKHFFRTLLCAVALVTCLPQAQAEKTLAERQALQAEVRAFHEQIKKDIESEFNSSENLENWLIAEDGGSKLEGMNQKKDWHFGLMLFGILFLLGSKNVKKSIIN